MKKRILILALCVVLTFLCASAAFAATSDQNKATLMAALKQTVLAEYDGIINQVQKLLYQDAVTVSDEQLADLMALTVSNESLSFVDRGTNLNDYTTEEQAVAFDLIDKVAAILDVTYKIEDTNDQQSNTGFVLSVYKDGRLLGKVNSDAKTDVGDTPGYWYLIVGGALLLTAVVIPLATRKKVVSD